ncbi:MAG: type II secretion system protein J [Myxococcales bacterium]
MNRSRATGFTLLEVMIAVAILGLIGGLTWKAFDSAADLKSRIERAEERDQTVRGAMNRIAREVSMTFLTEHYDRKRFRERPTRFVLKDGRREADLTFTSFANERLAIDAKEGDQALFEYKLGNDPDVSGRRNLYRRVKAIFDEDPDRGGQTAVLAEDVLAFSVEAWDPKDRSWRPDWDSNSTSVNPQALVPPRVKISLTIKDEQGKEKVYTTQSSIMLDQVLDF